MYVPLFCKSNFSFLEGASFPEELIEEAASLGLKALALTDRDVDAAVGRINPAVGDEPHPRIRRDRLGFVYQAHHLLPEFDALENVMIPQMIAGKSRAVARQEATRLLTVVGLGQRLSHRPSQLSGGEQQRVAIARAIAKRPQLLLCDEPTGALDYATGKLVLEVIARINGELGTTAVVITHNAAIGGMAHRIIRLADGRIASIEVPARRLTPAELAW